MGVRGHRARMRGRCVSVGWGVDGLWREVACQCSDSHHFTSNLTIPLPCSGSEVPLAGKTKTSFSVSPPHWLLHSFSHLFTLSHMLQRRKFRRTHKSSVFLSLKKTASYSGCSPLCMLPNYWAFSRHTVSILHISILCLLWAKCFSWGWTDKLLSLSHSWQQLQIKKRNPSPIANMVWLHSIVSCEPQYFIDLCILPFTICNILYQIHVLIEFKQ